MIKNVCLKKRQNNSRCHNAFEATLSSFVSVEDVFVCIDNVMRRHKIDFNWFSSMTFHQRQRLCLVFLAGLSCFTGDKSYFFVWFCEPFPNIKSQTEYYFSILK